MVAKISKFSKKKTSLLESVVAIGVFIVLLAALIGFFIFQNVKIGQKRSDLENRVQELQLQVYEMQEQGAELQENVEHIQTEEFQEKLLREQGLYQKEGEEVVTVLQGEEVPKEAVDESKGKRIWWKPWTW